MIKLNFTLFYSAKEFVFFDKIKTFQKVTQNSYVNKILNFQSIFTKLCHGSMPSLLNNCIKFQTMWFNRSRDIYYFMRALIKNRPVLIKAVQHVWLSGLGVWFALRVREVPGSNPGWAHGTFCLEFIVEKDYLYWYYIKVWKVCLGNFCHFLTRI